MFNPPLPDQHIIQTAVLLFFAEEYTVSAFSSFDDVANMKCPNKTSGPLVAGVDALNLLRVNWLINTYTLQQQQGFAPSCTLDSAVLGDWYQAPGKNTPAGTYGPITSHDMQAAIWTITGTTAGTVQVVAEQPPGLVPIAAASCLCTELELSVVCQRCLTAGCVDLLGEQSC